VPQCGRAGFAPVLAGWEPGSQTLVLRLAGALIDVKEFLIARSARFVIGCWQGAEVVAVSEPIPAAGDGFLEGIAALV
jgi:hypothetical protein